MICYRLEYNAFDMGWSTHSDNIETILIVKDKIEAMRMDYEDGDIEFRVFVCYELELPENNYT